MHRLDVVGAKILTTAQGGAIDTFRIDHSRALQDAQNPTDAELWSRVRADIEAALAGDLDVDAMVAQARRAYRAPTSVRKARQRIHTSVSIDNDVARGQTVVEVHAADRPGLLFTLASCLYALGMRISSALISTRVNRVVDIFYVTEADASKITDPARHEQVRQAVLDAIRLSDAVEAGEA